MFEISNAKHVLSSIHVQIRTREQMVIVNNESLVYRTHYVEKKLAYKYTNMLARDGPLSRHSSNRHGPTHPVRVQE